MQNIARDAAKNLPTPQEAFKKVTAEGRGHVLQIDNSHPSSGEGTAILLDAKPLWLLEEYNEAEITKFFVTLEGRVNVTCYISDMAEFLLRLGREYCLNATIVADPYHVVRRIQKNFDEVLKPFESAMLAEYICVIDEEDIVRPVRPQKIKRNKNNRTKENLPKTNIKEGRKGLGSLQPPKFASYYTEK